MRIGVMEWASCGGAIGSDDLPESIQAEGWAMCLALIESLCAGGHQPAACVLPELFAKTDFPTRKQLEHCMPLRSNLSVRDQWRECYSGCDATIVVAPESSGLLLEVEAWFESEGILTCESDQRFIERAGDKWLTAECFRGHHVPHPATELLSEWIAPADGQHAQLWAVKVRDGAGCDGMQVLTTDQVRAHQRLDRSWNNFIIQPWIVGQAYSRSAIVDAAGCCHWLPVVSQNLSVDRVVHYEGGCVTPNLELNHSHSEELERAISSLGGQPRGWIGVDFVIDDNEQMVVIEINPRLTTSFVGLSRACRASLAEQIVNARLARSVTLPQQWQPATFVV